MPLGTSRINGCVRVISTVWLHIFASTTSRVYTPAIRFSWLFPDVDVYPLSAVHRNEYGLVPPFTSGALITPSPDWNPERLNPVLNTGLISGSMVKGSGWVNS